MCVDVKKDMIGLFCSTDMVLDNMIAANQLETTLREQVFDTFMARHKHQNEKRIRHRDESRIHLPFVRSLADIGKKYSEPKGLSSQGERESFKGNNSLTIAEGKSVVRYAWLGVCFLLYLDASILPTRMCVSPRHRCYVCTGL